MSGISRILSNLRPKFNLLIKNEGFLTYSEAFCASL